MDDVPTQEAVRLTRWQAVVERLAQVRAGVSAWWKRVDRRRVGLWVMCTLALGSFAVAALLMFLSSSAPAVSDASMDGGSSLVHQGLKMGAPAGDLERRVLALERVAASDAWGGWAAPPSGTRAQPRAIVRAQPDPVSRGGVVGGDAAGVVPGEWGVTDLDRAIQDFTPPTHFGAVP